MPYTTETAKEASAKGHKAKAKYKDDLWKALSGGHQRKYNELLSDQYSGVEIKKPQKEAMDRTEKLFQYVKAKKTDLTTDGKELQPVLVTFLKDE